MSDKFEIGSLIKKLNKATEAYDSGNPIMTDKEWDNLYFKLLAAEKETGIIFSNSPTQKIYFEKVSKLPKAIHQEREMLSLDKTKNPNDIQSFVNGHDWLGMFKMDGLSCRLTYMNGKLIKGETRGDGVIGEDVTHNIKVIKNIPKILTNKNNYHKYNVEQVVIIDGEIICNYEDFKPFQDEYKNPRNFAAGSIRLLDAKECVHRNLSFIAWDLIKGIDEDFFAWRLEKLDEWGFDTVPRVCDAETIDDALNIFHNMRTSLPCSSYPIDGYVFRYESQKEYDEAGRTEHHFKGAYALKEYDEEYETELLDITYDVSRNGILTPVAVVKPVEIDGSTIERCSLHNLSVLYETLGHYPDKNQKVWITKKNMVIPQITKAIKNETPHDHILDWYPTYCPICREDTEIKKSDSGVLSIICSNPNCEGKLINRIDHYCGKKGLNIKGLSKKTISKLIDWEWLDGIKDIYELEKYKADWESKTGFGKASVEKILNTINAEGRHPKLESFISALGIPLIGTRVAKDIVKYYSTWDDFIAAIGGDWTELDGFGPEINRSLNNFDYTEACEIAAMLDFSPPEVQIKFPQSTTAANITFCVTGSLKSGRWKNRTELKNYIESIGGRVVNSMSSKVNYLINNDSTSQSAKNKTAKKNNIPIITEAEFIEQFGQN